MVWDKMAKVVEAEYGGYVDWDEEFFNCPECGEPIYKCDWDAEELVTDGGEYFCPVCESVID